MLLAAAHAHAEPDLVLTGTVTGADHQTYRRIPFDVPPGVDRINVHFDYDRANRTTVDLGLEDPQRFRGWSGGNKSAFHLSEVTATPSYLPGPLPAGTWHLVLGMPNVRQDTSAHYRAEIAFMRGADAFSQSLADRVLRDEPGWYRGDLHTHSGHSDGACVSRTGNRVPCPAYRTLEAAAERGLHFVALTEHNARSHFQSLLELQSAFDDMVLLTGREVTTFYGHFNVFGTTAPIDFRTGAQGMGTLLGRAAEAGGLVSINHPSLPSGEACMGCGWRADDGWQHVTAVEVVNGGTLRATNGDPGSLSGIPFWEQMLDRGLRVTAVAGSDNHDAGVDGTMPGAVGYPTTVIEATALSQTALLEGMRAGRVFVDLDGGGKGGIDLAAQSASGSAVMGGALEVVDGDEVVVTVMVSDARDATVRLIRSGAPPLLPESPPTRSEKAQRWTFRLAADGALGWIRAEALDPAGRLLLLSNAVYVVR